MNIIELDEFDEIVNSVKREYKVQLEYKKKVPHWKRCS